MLKQYTTKSYLKNKKVALNFSKFMMHMPIVVKRRLQRSIYEYCTLGDDLIFQRFQAFSEGITYATNPIVHLETFL